MKILNTGVIGLGRFGEVITSILSTLPNIEIKALSSKSMKRIKEVAAKNNIKSTNFYTDYKDLIDDEEIQAIFIASEAKHHKEQALHAIRKGKHVFLEKPPALTYKDSMEVVNEAKKAGIFLMIGYLYRYEVNRSILKRYIRSGQMGEIIYLNFKNSCSRSWFQENSHYFHPVHETMIHDIDLALWYANSKVKSVYAKQIYVYSDNVPDVCLATVTFNNGIIATFDTNWLIPDGAPMTLEKYNGTLESSFELVATKMMSRMRLTDNGFSIWTDNGVIRPEISLYPENNGQYQGALKAEIEDYIKCVFKKEKSQIASVDDAVYGMKIADSIVQAAVNNKVIKLIS